MSQVSKKLVHLSRSIEAGGGFNNLDWKTITEYLGAHLNVWDKQRGVVEIYSHALGGQIIISDNGGEVNISKVVPLIRFSVPYQSTLFDVGEATMADRLHKAIKGIPIDYNSDLDSD